MYVVIFISVPRGRSSLRHRFYTTRIGIDFGTTNSVVAVMEADVPRVIETLEGDRTSASAVTYLEDGTCEVGAPAKRQAISNPHNTFWATKLLLGKSFDDPLVSELRKVVPYKIVKGPAGEALLEDSLGRRRSPVEIAAAVIRKMKENAESHLGTQAEGAVVSSPGYFNEKQRKALTEAIEKAGLPLINLVPEHIAAAVGHALPASVDQKILVFHFGGGTFDASVLDYADGEYEVKSTITDLRLGGQQLDQRIINMVLDQFTKENNFDLTGDLPAMQRVRDAAERARTELSTSLRANINLNYIAANEKGPMHINIVLTRAKLEELVQDLLERSISLANEALEKAGVPASQVGTVLAVGGVCKMPRIRDMLTEVMGKEPIRPVNPDEAVASGAAMLAGKKASKEAAGGKARADLVMQTIGIETAGGVFVPIVPSGTPIPCEKRIVVSTNSDAQRDLTLSLYQGERLLAKDNRFIGKIDLKGIPRMPKGFPQVEVVVNVDFTGWITIIAREKLSNISQFFRSPFGGPGRWGGLDSKAVSQLRKVAEHNHEVDSAKKLRIETVQKAHSVIVSTQRELKSLNQLIQPDDLAVIQTKLNDLLAILVNDSVPTDQLQQAIAELEDASRDPFSKAIISYRNNEQTNSM